ncbi:MAG: molybdopterin molybdotransferase MoeA [Chthoniobacterales bacterium]|nr:molybdopterin molybdotransferase MoeA [Chthoniobacterales bacterium]
MITPVEALRRILAGVQPRPSREIPLLEAVDQFAAEDLFARIPVPPFDNSAMDGYAVVASSCAAGQHLRIVGEQPAGIDRGLSIRAGEALRIFTGAPLPRGADAVIMQEDTTVEGSDLLPKTAPVAGEFVRRRGADVAEGQKVLAEGDRISVQRIALLASQGLRSVSVGGEVNASLISTGDELAEPGAALLPGQIYDSNSVFLEALLRKSAVHTVRLTHCADNSDEIEAALKAASASDLIILTGGVSVGAHDLVKAALSAIGATLDLWRIAVKPGKPFLFGHLGSAAIFGLPGNPVSAFVTFLLFVRPALLKMRGANESARRLPEVSARLSEEIRNDGPRPHYIRGLLRDSTFESVGLQESHALFGLSRSNALLLVGPDEVIAAGASVRVLTLG